MLVVEKARALAVLKRARNRVVEEVKTRAQELNHDCFLDSIQPSTEFCNGGLLGRSWETTDHSKLYLAGYEPVGGETGLLPRIKPSMMIKIGKKTELIRWEAEALRRLDHPNIVQLIGEESNYLLLKLVQGMSMAAYCPGLREALYIAFNINRALGYCHDRGVVHRDVKPSNILIDRTGRVRLIDFELAKMPDLGEHLGPNNFFGSPYFSEPRLWQQGIGVATIASDVYAFGITIMDATRELKAIISPYIRILCEYGLPFDAPFPDEGEVLSEAQLQKIPLNSLRGLMPDLLRRNPDLRLVDHREIEERLLLAMIEADEMQAH